MRIILCSLCELTVTNMFRNGGVRSLNNCVTSHIIFSLLSFVG